MTFVRSPAEAPPPAAGRAVPGRRFVLLFFAAGAAISALIVLVTVLAVRDPGDPDPACRGQPDVCAAVRDYVDAANKSLGEHERMEDLRITSVSVTGDTATARVRFMRNDVPIDASYALQSVDGRWEIER
jgi:hypothetical protein